jgi:hypothetical protein
VPDAAVVKAHEIQNTKSVNTLIGVVGMGRWQAFSA